MRFAAFLRGVNLGKRTVKSAELKACFEAMGFADVKTLLASGNVLFDAPSAKGLQTRVEKGLGDTFGFPIGTVLRSLDDLRRMVASDPFSGRVECHDYKLFVALFSEPLPKSFAIDSVPGDYDTIMGDGRELFIVGYRKPDGTYSAGSLLNLEKRLPKGQLVTSRNWNTILKAIA